MTAPHARAGRRAVRHWTWRLFRREWRQQLLVMALLGLVVAAMVVMAAAATNAAPPSTSGVGDARFAMQLPTGPRLAAELRTLTRSVGPVEVVAHRSWRVPGTTQVLDVRAESPRGRYSGPLLALQAGRYPTGPRQVALSPVAAQELGLGRGSWWHGPGGARRVVGIVENPTSLLDAFALVAPGQLAHPTGLTVLFDRSPARLPPGLRALVSTGSRGGGTSAALLVDLAAALGLTLIGMVSVAAFATVAQRRQRALGLLASVGAPVARVRQVVLTNGALVGIVGVVVGGLTGFGLWALYRPHLESTSHHRIALGNLPLGAVGVGLALALLTPIVASLRPAREVARQPIVRALEGRPPAPRPVTRSAAPGVVAMVVGFALLGYAAGRAGASLLLVLVGFVALMTGLVLLAPTLIASLGILGRRAPLSARLAIRDLTRYRARSASTLAAVSIGVMTAMIVMVAASARYADPLDYIGPNLSHTEVVVAWAPRSAPPSAQQAGVMVAAMAHAVSATVLPLETTSATLVHQAPGRNWSGPIFVATPALLRTFGIAPSSIEPSTLVITMRPGLAGVAHLALVVSSRRPVVAPTIQTLSALPSGTSAPNTDLTEHAVSSLHLMPTSAGWLLTTAAPLTAAQVVELRQSAAVAGLTVETASSMPTSAQVTGWATGAALALALALVLAALGLMRGETVEDRRVLATLGASPATRRGVAAVVAGLLALLGAVLGSLGAYVAVAAVLRAQPLGGGLVRELTQVPAINLVVLFVGLPALAGTLGFLLAGGEPARLVRHLE